LYFSGKVYYNAFDFAAIIAVDGTGTVEHGQAFFYGQAAARADLRLRAGGQGNVQAGGDEQALHGVELQRRWNIGAQIHAGAAGSFVLRQRIWRTVDDAYLQAVLILRQK